MFYAMNAVPPENIPTGWLALNIMLATALPDRWPRPASHPPKPDANGVVEGEAFQIIGLTAGSVEIQDFANLSKKFQLWWRGAKEGDRLMLRFEVPHRGRYAVDGEFCHAADRGDVTLQLGSIRKRLSFRGCTARLGPHRSRPRDSRGWPTRPDRDGSSKRRSRWDYLPSRSGFASPTTHGPDVIRSMSKVAREERAKNGGVTL